MSKFRDEYQPQDGDMCVREVRTDRYEVSVWRGDLQEGGWHDQKLVSLAEFNKFIRSTCKSLGKHGEWEYYRSGGA